MVLMESLQGFGESEITDSGDEISFRREGIQDRRVAAAQAW